MTIEEFTNLLQQPDTAIGADQTGKLDEIIAAYPYFQAARAIQLKGLKDQDSFKYNDALKITAAYTADREVLFDLITSEEFLQNAIADNISGKAPLTEKEIISEEIDPNPDAETTLIESSGDEPLPRSAKDADQILDPALFSSVDPEVDKALDEARQKAKEKLDLGRPLPFTKKEKHSFGEWLQLTSLKVVKRKGTQEADVGDIEFPLDDTSKPMKNQDLIDRFLENEPKLVPREDDSPKIDIKQSVKIDKNELMTETLAKVYLEQKKYKKAIQAYRILSLKYPEKSSFFADRIKSVKELQKENKN